MNSSPQTEVQSAPKVFISYSWDSAAHKEWVHALAQRLYTDGIDVFLDQWHLVAGDQITHFMERAVQDNDFVLIICTPRYKTKSDARTGGVGYEGDIMTAEVASEGNHRKFVPILRRGEWRKAAPVWLKGKYYRDLRGKSYSESEYQNLLADIRRTPKGPQAALRKDAAEAYVPKLQLQDVFKGVLFGAQGYHHLLNEFAYPFMRTVDKALRSAGLREALDNPVFPRGIPEFNPSQIPLQFGLRVAVGATIGPLIIELISEQFCNKIVRPALESLAKEYRKKYEKKGQEYPFNFEFMIVFLPENLRIIVQAATQTSSELSLTGKLLAEAQHRSLDWIQEKGITANQMVWILRQGHLSAFPKLL